MAAGVAQVHFRPNSKTVPMHGEISLRVFAAGGAKASFFSRTHRNPQKWKPAHFIQLLVCFIMLMQSLDQIAKINLVILPDERASVFVCDAQVQSPPFTVG